MMERAFSDAETVERLIVYAGRFSDRVRDSVLLEERDVLSDWDVLSTRLRAAVGEASPLVIVDLFSFPFEAITGELESVPLVLVLPRGFDADFLTAVFGGPALERLGFFDRVATGDDALWEELRRRYGWVAAQRIDITAGSTEEAVKETLAGLVETGPATAADARGNGALSGLSLRRASRGVRGRPALDKSVHRAQAAVLEPQFLAARGGSVEGVPFKVLEVGAGAGRWATSFELASTRFIGLDDSEDMVEAARANIPGASFERLGDDLVVPYDDESFDLAFCVGYLQRIPTPAKRVVLSEMWRVTRSAGRLMFLEDFVAGERSEGPGVHTTSVLEFVELLLEATGGQVVLEHVESLRYPNEELVRGGLLAVSKLGVPKTW